MADVNRGDRPLSPHLLIYRPQITSMLSIVHRVTGVGLFVGFVLGVWWFFAAAAGPEYFELVDWIVTSWIGNLVMLGCCWALWYHFCNGIRHLFWDAGYGFELETVTKTGYAVLIASGVLTVLTVIVMLASGGSDEAAANGTAAEPAVRTASVASTPTGADI